MFLCDDVSLEDPAASCGSSHPTPSDDAHWPSAQRGDSSGSVAPVTSGPLYKPALRPGGVTWLSDAFWSNKWISIFFCNFSRSRFKHNGRFFYLCIVIACSISLLLDLNYFLNICLCKICNNRLTWLCLFNLIDCDKVMKKKRSAVCLSPR